MSEGPLDKKEAPSLASGGARSDERGSCQEYTDDLEWRQSPFYELAEAWELLQLGPPREYKETENGNWRLQPVSESQLRALGRFGVSVPREDWSLNRGNAARMLSALIRRIRKGKCPFTTAQYLHRQGVKNASELTINEAEFLLRELPDSSAEKP